MKYQVDTAIEALYSQLSQDTLEGMATALHKMLQEVKEKEPNDIDSDLNTFRHDCLVLALENIINRFKPSEEIQRLVDQYGAIKTQLDLF